MTSQRSIEIDMLRGISILFVILLHIAIRANIRETSIGDLVSPQWYNFLFRSGFYGVAIFFVISGFLITKSAITKWGNVCDVSAKEFYLFRIARIIPLLVILVVILSILHIFEVPGFVIREGVTSLGRAAIAALAFHINWLQIQVGYLPGSWDILWSLSIEEVFYFCFPALCLLARKEWHFVGLASVFVLLGPWARVALYVGNELGSKNYLANMDGIALGCITAILVSRWSVPQKWRKWLIAAGVGLLLFILYFRGLVYQLGLTKNGLYMTVLSLGVCLFLAGNFGSKRTRWLENVAPFRWLASMGRYSYEIYLTHMFVVVAIVMLFRKFELAGNWYYAIYVTAIAGSFVLGRVVSRYLSEPINRRLRERWLPKFSSKEKSRVSA